MENRNNKGLILGIVAMIVAIIGTGVAFAALGTTLNVTGTAKVTPASWNIHFRTLSSPTITGAATVPTPPVLSDTTINNFNIVLTKPGDSVTYTFYVENSGSLAARIGTFTAPTGPTCTGTGTNATNDASTVCTNLTYTYKNVTTGNTIAAGEVLAAGASTQIELKIMYNSTATALPDAEVTISGLGFSMNYIEN